MTNPPMINGVHILLTYTCTYECDHCFAWGSPWQEGTLTLEKIDQIIQQSMDLGTVEWIYFEGGEPFLFHPVLVRSVERAADSGFKVGVVTNGYWATSEADARQWLGPLVGRVKDLAISSDLFHYSEKISRQSTIAGRVAEQLGIPADVITISKPVDAATQGPEGQLPHGESPVRFRGRAASTLAADQPKRPWQTFTECPCEDLADPGRVHVDPLGWVHLCQGLTIGNLFSQPLKTLWDNYNPKRHPITGPILEGGPAELARRYSAAVDEGFADACHLCYEVRRQLRPQFPHLLGPDQMYGVFGASE